MLALLRWRSTSSIPGYGRLSFETAASWLDQAAVQNERTLTAGSLPGLVPAPETAPNELPPSAYDFLERARAINIDQEGLQALHGGIPQYDDDEFMTAIRLRLLGPGNGPYTVNRRPLYWSFSRASCSASSSLCARGEHVTTPRRVIMACDLCPVGSRRVT